MRGVRSARYAGERRSSVRFVTDLPGRLDGIEAWVHDLALTGARVEIPSAVGIAGSTRLVVDVPDGDPIALDAIVRGMWPAGAGRVMAGLEYAEGQWSVRAHLALALFGIRARRAAEAPSAKPIDAPRRRRRTPGRTRAAA